MLGLHLKKKCVRWTNSVARRNITTEGGSSFDGWSNELEAVRVTAAGRIIGASGGIDPGSGVGCVSRVGLERRPEEKVVEGPAVENVTGLGGLHIVLVRSRNLQEWAPYNALDARPDSIATLRGVPAFELRSLSNNSSVAHILTMNL